MIASLRGKLVSKTAEQAVIECAGVGYGVYMSLASLVKLGTEGSDVHVLIHTHLTQDALRLFGFADAAEREVFEILISLSGVGPKLALAVLSILSAGELSDAVARGDKAMLTRVPGVGAKKAERLLVDLKGRLDGVTTVPAKPGLHRSTILDDLISALVNLGYQPKDAEKSARGIVEARPDERDLTVLVRDALRAS